ncbi:peptidoglycan-binding protein [Paracoccus laeviglucosivorans]|nr:peptidoglycan-binding protein [Paracoccus laeviglucosivorans]
MPALRRAESDLKTYEVENNFRFAELDQRDREAARSFQVESGMSERIFRGGITIVWVAVISMAMMILLLLLLTAGMVKIDATNTNFAMAAFGLIGSAVGFVNGLAATVVTFYWGSSQGSKEKTEALNASLKQASDELGQLVSRQIAPPQPVALLPAPEIAAPEPPPLITVRADPGLIRQILATLGQQHRQFEGSVTWALIAEGISVEGGRPVGTTGDPVTVTRIWKEFGIHCVAAAKRYGVPVELIVATIATESSGKPDAFRQEKNDASFGLMQTLLESAREALGDKRLSGNDLFKPDISIMAGTAYIARQRDKTNFDPVLVAAAYNAGSPRHAKFEGNRWRLWCHPPEGGYHIDKFVARFNDAMAVSRKDSWFADECPSFVGAFEPDAQTGNPAGPTPNNALAPLGAQSAAAAQATTILRALATPLPFAAIGGNKELVIAVQQKLSEQGYLDPPPDGSFGSVSGWAVHEFCLRNGIGDQLLDMAAAELLIAPKAPLANPVWSGDWMDRVIDHMARNGYWFSRFPECRNIVYLEGADPDGGMNSDEPDKFNDLRIVFWFDTQGAIKHLAWEATTEPGDFFTDNPVNPAGAARIKFGQYKAWAVGIHRGDHEALVQVADVSVYRDKNRDRIRTGDAIDTGIFGINQHWGYDVSRDSIKNTSAGCLVGRTTAGHKEFMQSVKSDPRYRANNSYKFVTTILPADQVLRA